MDDLKSISAAFKIKINDEAEMRALKEKEALKEVENGCYVCKAKYKEFKHEYYFTMCPDCADLNFRKRN
jgi:hypothetical protein